MIECATCKRMEARDSGVAPLWDDIIHREFWDVVHAFNTSLPGWIVLVARRHIEALDELTEGEARELGALLWEVSIALKEIVDCSKTYVMQFAEHPDHPHVHFHVVPRMEGIPPENAAAKVFAYLGVDEQNRVSERDINAIATALVRMLDGWWEARRPSWEACPPRYCDTPCRNNEMLDCVVLREPHSSAIVGA